ncbi:MAG TPA: RHS repeat protein, partial [Phycisphaerales bacterium]|nr:RHS repeat protein [Phycisphaerales bacterium]
MDTSSVTCRPWGQGQAWLRWASVEEPGSDITLTAGPCGEAGETARGYVFACMDVHDAVCVGSTPCGGDTANHGTLAILRVSGDPTAFRHIFPDGLSITSDQIVGLHPEVNYAHIAVEKAGCDYRIGLAGPPQMRLRLEATVAQCLSDFENSTFGITVTFYQQRSQNPDRYSLLARTRGSITVKANKRTGHDPIAFTPDLRDGSSIGWIEKVQRVYASGGEDCWTIPCREAHYNGEEVTCSRVDAWLGPVNIPDTSRYLVPNSATYDRVKYPSYRKDVYATPAYAAMDGWSYNLNDRYIALDLGDQGTLYYHCDKKLDETRYAVSSIERCGPGVPAGEGQTEWLLRYDGDRLTYIYNTAEPVGDPNSPQGTRCYVYDWTGGTVQVTYQRRPDLVSPWSTARQWELEFDAEGRAIKYDAGCWGSCGSSGGDFEHVEYDPDFEDLIVKRSDAQGRTVLLNTYAQVIYGPYVPAYPVGLGNAGFESDAVDEGTCRQDLLPSAWTLADGEQASIWVCDDANSAPEGAQFLHLNGAVALEQTTAERAQEQMGYTLRAAVRALPGQTGQTATITLFASSDTAREYPLLALMYDAVGDPEAGQWKSLEGTWESGPYEPVDENERMIVEVTGNLVQIDDIRLEVAARLYNRSRPVLVKQEAADLANPEGLVTVAEWTYPQDDNGRTVVEKRRVDETHWAVTEYEYDDSSLSRLAGKTEYTALQTTPAAPTGTSYTTLYDPNDVHGTSVTVYPNNFEPGFEGGKRADVRRYDTAGNLIESYVVDRVTDVNSLLEQYTYVHYTGGSEDQWLVEEQTNPRGGVTQHSYRLYGSGSTMTPRHLLESRIGPATEAGSQEVWYNYDGAMRLISERRKDTLGRWVTTGYTYDPETGFLEAVVQHGEGVHARTEYKHNDFGQVVRQIDPDGVVTGKAYGQGGELVSEFVLAEGADPNAPDQELMLVSQTRYAYDENGRLETVTKGLDEGPFLYDLPDDWVATRYAYDSRGRKRAVIEDWDEAGLRANLRTSYEYDEQGRLRQTTYPTGRWVRTTRDGRGLVTLEEVGYGDDPAEVVVYTTGYEYDANGNLIEQVNPDGTVLIHRYDNFDRLRKTYQYSTSGPWTYREYDAAGAVALEQAFEADGTPLQDRRRVYDVAGRPTLERTTASPGAPADANDLITTYGYDVAGNVRWVIAKGVGSSDPNGMIEPNDVVTEYRYDALGRKIATIDPEGIWTTFAYSPGGR